MRGEIEQNRRNISKTIKHYIHGAVYNALFSCPDFEQPIDFVLQNFPNGSTTTI